MDARAVSPSQDDFRDMQGLLRYGYRMLTDASFLLVRIRNRDAACAWIRQAPVNDAMERPAAPETALHLAFTRQGLQALEVPESIVEQFSLEFLGGMSEDPGRSRLLGDVARNAPENWEWGGPGVVPDALVLLYARPGHLHEWSIRVQNELWDMAFEVLHCLPTTDQGEAEPFGFKDSLSQPVIDWKGSKRLEDKQLTYSNVVSVGEFVLGYQNEYGRLTDRPLLPKQEESIGLPTAADLPSMSDLGRNGCYLVVRTLEQDVAGFWRFAREVAGDEAEAFAAAMVGRTRDGAPLVPLSEDPIDGVEAKDAPVNQFTFDHDPRGVRCPFGAHIRRANPRNADLPTPPVHGLQEGLRVLGLGRKDLHSDAKASTRFHRILRRGREFGPELPAGQAVTVGNQGHARGIHFLCLVANIARQFEFLQSAWMNSSKFDALTDESDPLLGNREPVGAAITNTFTCPRENGLRERVEGMPQFVTVKGGAYFFLPSLAFLRYVVALDRAAVTARTRELPLGAKFET